MSEAFSAREASTWTAARLRQGDAERRFESVTIDSRALDPGALFIAIAGERFDGHDFLEAVVSAGAGGLLVHTGTDLPAAAQDVVVLEVEDTTRALGALAAGHRSRHRGELVAITGSNGKTTTKEMLAAILSTTGPCLKNEGNLNNEFGLPLTLLRREARHHSVVVELGMNHRGEIARLAAIARPSVGVITNVGTAHIEHLGSREEIALEKGDLVASLAPEGVAVLNLDDPLVAAAAERTRARVLGFGVCEEADVRGTAVRVGNGDYAFTIEHDGASKDVSVAGLGDTTIANALAAAAGALAAGAKLEHVARGLDAYRPPSGRLEPVALAGGGLLIDDTYNANPQSMEIALRTLVREAQAGERAGQRIAVLGDMGELGAESERAHRESGELAARLGVDLLFAVGERAESVVAAAREAGMQPGQLFAARDPDVLAKQVLEHLRPADRVLVKGSRAMRMERIANRVRERDGAESED